MKQTFNIPAGCTVGSIEQDGDKVIIEFKSEYTPKRGDVCVMTTDTGQDVIILVESVLGQGIHTFAEFWTRDTIFNINDQIPIFATDTFRPATEEEKQILFSKLKEKGKRFNPDKMCIEEELAAAARRLVTQSLSHEEKDKLIAHLYRCIDEQKGNIEMLQKMLESFQEWHRKILIDRGITN